MQINEYYISEAVESLSCECSSGIREAYVQQDVIDYAQALLIDDLDNESEAERNHEKF